MCSMVYTMGKCLARSVCNRRLQLSKDNRDIDSCIQHEPDIQGGFIWRADSTLCPTLFQYACSDNRPQHPKLKNAWRLVSTYPRWRSTTWTAKVMLVGKAGPLRAHDTDTKGSAVAPIKGRFHVPLGPSPPGPLHVAYQEQASAPWPQQDATGGRPPAR